MFTMAKIMEMKEAERNKIALYLINSVEYIYIEKARAYLYQNMPFRKTLSLVAVSGMEASTLKTAFDILAHMFSTFFGLRANCLHVLVELIYVNDRSRSYNVLDFLASLLDSSTCRGFQFDCLIVGDQTNHFLFKSAIRKKLGIVATHLSLLVQAILVLTLNTQYLCNALDFGSNTNHFRFHDLSSI